MSLDTNDARTTGRAKAGAGLAASNAMGWGEQTTLALQKTEGKTFALLGYSHPLHASGTRAALSLGQLKYRLVNGSQVEGDANTWSLSISQPWIRSEGYNLSSALAYNASDSNTRSATDSRSQVGTTTLGLNGNWLDALGGASFNSWGLQWAAGKEDKTESTAHTNNRFRKWVYNALRMQRVSPLGTLSLSVNGQWAGSALPSSETFSLGGASAVRAYPAFEGNGDRGWVEVLEYRHDLSAGHVLKAFYDHGRIHRLAATSGPAQYALKGVGLGWDATVHKSLQIKTAVAWRLGNNPYPSTNGQDADGSLRPALARPDILTAPVPEPGTRIRILSTVDFKGNRHNLYIVALSVGFGLVPLVAPRWFQQMPHSLHPLLESGILLTAVAAVVLNIFFNGAREDRAGAVDAAKLAEAH